MKKLELTKTFYFDAAHNLSKVPPEHKCSNVHGHTFRVDVTISGEVNQQQGWVMDFGDIKSIVQPVIDRLDHHYLNQIKGLEKGTSELLVMWLWDRIKPLLPKLTKIVVWESPNSHCTYSE